MGKLISDNIPMLLALEGKEAVTREADPQEYWVMLKAELLAKINRFLVETDNDSKMKSLADLHIILEHFERQADLYLTKNNKGIFEDYLAERRLYVGEYDKKLVLLDVKQGKKPTDEDRKKELMDYGEKNNWPAIILSGTKENPLKVLGPGRDKWDNAMSWFDVSRDNVDEWLAAVRRNAIA